MPDVGWPLLFIVLGLIGTVIMAVSQPQLFFVREPEEPRDGEKASMEHASGGDILKPRRLWGHLLNAMPDEAPHLFIYGPSGSGKTVFAQSLIAERAGQVVVLDPKWQVGKWGGAPAYSVDDEGRHGSLHAKCAVADRELLLISSANLTHYALSLNMELGLLLRGGPQPREVDRHFRALIDQGALTVLPPNVTTRSTP